MTYKLLLGDCLTIMPTLQDQSIDSIILDLPYQVTQCKSWDYIIPFEPMWKEVDRLLKPHGVFVTTASQPFTSKLVMSKIEWFKYDLIWDKVNVSGYLNSKKMPLRQHEDICIFSCETNGNYTYNPILIHTGQKRQKGRNSVVLGNGARAYGTSPDVEVTYDDIAFPKSIVTFPRGRAKVGVSHPTQKPVELYDYLVKTYSNENDTVLDFCFGSGTTAIACMMNNRNFVGIEQDEAYYNMALQRVKEYENKQSELLFTTFEKVV